MLALTYHNRFKDEVIGKSLAVRNEGDNFDDKFQRVCLKLLNFCSYLNTYLVMQDEASEDEEEEEKEEGEEAARERTKMVRRETIKLIRTFKVLFFIIIEHITLLYILYILYIFFVFVRFFICSLTKQKRRKKKS